MCSSRAHEPVHLSLKTCVLVLQNPGPGGKYDLVRRILVTFCTGPQVLDHDLICRAPIPAMSATLPLPDSATRTVSRASDRVGLLVPAT